MAPVESAETNPDRFAHVLGLAALDLWSELPRELQQTLFERAVVLGHQTERDESLREQLAQFLHDHHERTAGRFDSAQTWNFGIKGICVFLTNGLLKLATA